MMRSLFSGVSGLKTHQTRMDVIGNNIANVNTTAYKSKSINFSDMLYQTTQSATAPNATNNTAGTNARQIGLGVKTGAINTSITTEGSSQSTGNPFDLKITGEAFFVVTDGTNQYFTRDGSFDVDAAGNLCMASTGYIVEGWTNTDSETGAIIQDSVKPIKVLSASNETYPASNTTTATVSGIIDKYDDQLETDNGKIVNIQVLDDKGYEYNLKFGITPSTYSQTTNKDALTTETLYKAPTTLQLKDNSTLTYYLDATLDASNKVVDGTGNELASTGVPSDLLNALEAAANTFISGGTLPTGVTIAGGATTFTQGQEQAIQITIDDDFINAYKTTYPGLDDLKNAATIYNQPITISISGDTTYEAYNGTTLLGEIDLTDDERDALYDASATANQYTLKTDYQNGLLLTNKTYTDGTADSNVLSLPNSSAAITGLSYSSDISALLDMQTSTIQAQYTINEPTTDDSAVRDGYYIISLIGMTDSEGTDVSGWKDTINFQPVTVKYNTGDGSFEYVGSEGNDSFSVNLSLLGTNFSSVSFDMSNTSNVNNGGKSTIAGTRDDGYKVGNLTGVSIGQDGTITANYDNGMQKAIAQISVATFANSMGLENVGDNLYQQTSNSGEFDGVGVDIKGSGTGYMTTGVLEMSNVDLSQEFTDMITTQRGFQANSRVITVSDTLLEELVNLKR
jgi:flagellar hook protein FlgE